MGKLLILVGPSGCGKTTIGKQVALSTSAKIAVSHTSRKPRAGELEGTDYYYIDAEEFKAMIHAKEMHQWVLYSGNFYGLKNSELDTTNNHVIAIVEPSGAEDLRSRFKGAISVYLETYTQTPEEYRDRMLARGDPEKIVNKRMLTLSHFEDYKNKCDVLIKESNITEAARRISNLLHE